GVGGGAMRYRRWTILVCGLFLAASCQRHARVSKVPLSAPPPSSAAPASAALDHADDLFNGGKFQEAGKSYQNYLQLFPEGSLRDQALFRLGLSRSLDGPSPDWTGASVAFKQLIDEFPQSPLKSAASLILALHSEVVQLTADSKQHDQKIRQ